MLNGYKSYIAAGVIFLSGLALLITGQIEPGQFTLILGNALGIAGIKHAIDKK